MYLVLIIFPNVIHYGVKKLQFSETKEDWPDVSCAYNFPQCACVG